MTLRNVVFPENMDTLKGLPYDEGTKKYYVDPNPLVDGVTITTKGDSPNRKLTVNRQGLGFLAGNSLSFNDENGLDVLHDDSLVTNPSGELGLNPEILEGIDRKIRIAIDEIQTTDRLLERVEYDDNTHNLLFYVGETGKDGDETILRVFIGDLLPVTVGNGLQGRGTTTNPVSLKIDPASTGVTVSRDGIKISPPDIRVTDDENNSYLHVGSERFTIPKGITCETISQLPKASWEEGMSVLAKRRNGQCVNLVPSDSIFQTVNLAARAGKVEKVSGQTLNTLTGFLEDTYQIIYTITNSGEDESTAVTLKIQEPLLEAGILTSAIKNVTTNGAENVSAATFDANKKTWTIRVDKLRVGGNVTLTWEATASQARTYQVGAFITVEPGLLNKGNNLSSTHTLSVNSRKIETVVNDENIGQIGTLECPFLTATIDGVELIPAKPIYVKEKPTGYNIGLNKVEQNIIFKNSLMGKPLKIKMSGARNIRIFKKNLPKSNVVFYESADSEFVQGIYSSSTSLTSNFTDEASSIGKLFAKNSAPAAASSTISTNSDYVENKIGYSFDPQIGDLVINSSVGEALYIFARPESPECAWQLFVVLTPRRKQIERLTVEPGSVSIQPSDKVSIDIFNHLLPYSEAKLRVIPKSREVTDEDVERLKNGELQLRRAEFGAEAPYNLIGAPTFQADGLATSMIYREKIIVKLKKGHRYEFDLNVSRYFNGWKARGYFSNAATVGDITISNIVTRYEHDVPFLSERQQASIHITVLPTATETNNIIHPEFEILMVD